MVLHVIFNHKKK